MNGYDTPCYVDAVLGTIYVLLAAAVIMAAWAALRSYRSHASSDGKENGVPARRIALAIAIVTVAVLVVTWFTASTEPLNINGRTFADSFWLRASDMLISTAVLMMAILIVVAIVGTVKGLSHKE